MDPRPQPYPESLRAPAPALDPFLGGDPLTAPMVVVPVPETGADPLARQQLRQPGDAAGPWPSGKDASYPRAASYSQNASHPHAAGYAPGGGFGQPPMRSHP